MTEQLALFDLHVHNRAAHQVIFERVAQHLFQQGQCAMWERDMCAYRGDDGTRCAVGALIADEEYHPEMEGRDLHMLLGADGLTRWPTLERLVPFAGLLDRLQEAHDKITNWASSEAMRRALRGVAGQHGLEAGFLDAMAFRGGR